MELWCQYNGAHYNMRNLIVYSRCVYHFAISLAFINEMNSIKRVLFVWVTAGM